MKKIWSVILSAAMLFQPVMTGTAEESAVEAAPAGLSSGKTDSAGAAAGEISWEGTGFDLTESREAADLGGTVYWFTHRQTGAEVVYVDNGSDTLEFSIGFWTPATDNKGANHVLEHSLLCGSEKYPTKNIMHYLNATALARMTAVTVDDYTYYSVKSENEAEYYGLLDVHLEGIFHPLLLQDEHIFHQQGIRLEYADGGAQYNGVVYNELKIKNLENEDNSINELADELYQSIYGDTAPSFNSGGTIEGVKSLTYEDVLQVYRTYYLPSNSMVYLAGTQDVQKTLSVLNDVFSGFDREEVTVSFTDTKQETTEKVQEYNITPDTKTADIGFMASGVPATSDLTELFAWEIVFNLIQNNLQDKVSEISNKIYSSGGGSGGISNAAVLVSEVPVEKKDDVIAAYRGIVEGFSENGFAAEELDSAIAEYFALRRDTWSYPVEQSIFQGLMYHSDPFAFIEISGAEEELNAHKEVFDQILRTYFTENLCQAIIVYGNGGKKAAEKSPQLSEEALEQLKADTEEFWIWADEPDIPEVIERIPMPSLDEAPEEPEYAQPVREEDGGISFYYTEKENASTASATLYFPIGIGEDKLKEAELLLMFISAQAEKQGISGEYFDLAAMQNYCDSESVNPQFVIGLYGDDGEMAEKLHIVMDFLDGVWDETTFAEYVKNAPKEILENGYGEPFYLSYELMQSAQSAGKRLYNAARGCLGQGSPAYYHFLKDMEDVGEAFNTVQNLARERMIAAIPTVKYIGGSGYEAFKTAAAEEFADARETNQVSLELPEGYYSAATITKIPDSNHFMLAAYFPPEKYSGQLNVLARVLTTGYILPKMRGKYGAYGAGLNFDDQTSMVSFVTGLSDIDLTIGIWQGMGDWLRELQMPQKLLDAMAVSAVREFDEWYSDSDDGAMMALTGKTTADIQKIREEMLSVTIEDMRNYADFIDELVSQMRIFAVLGQEAADNAEFSFAYYASAEDLTIIPQP